MSHRGGSLKKRRPSGFCSCGLWRQTLHRDHKIPKWKGGLDVPKNWQYICANCHEDKTREDLKGRERHDLRGKPRSAEVCAKISATKLARPHRVGYPKSPETRAKISATNIATKAARRAL